MLKTQQADKEIFLGNAEFLEDAGKAEAVQQPEAKDHDRAPWTECRPHDVFHGDIDDRRGNQWLDDGRWQVDDLRRTEAEGNGMRDRKGGDLGQDRTYLGRQEENAHDKQDMVRTLWQDVRVADLEEVDDHVHSGARLDVVDVQCLAHRTLFKNFGVHGAGPGAYGAHQNLSELGRPAEGEGLGIRRKIAMKVDDRFARLGQVADFRVVDRLDLGIYALPVDHDVHALQKLRLERLEDLLEFCRRQSPQSVIFGSVGTVGRVLHIRIDAGQDGFEIEVDAEGKDLCIPVKVDAAFRCKKDVGAYGDRKEREQGDKKAEAKMFDKSLTSGEQCGVHGRFFLGKVAVLFQKSSKFPMADFYDFGWILR
jgi:hypothetical protein